ncbi:hypothetical protein FDZ71_00430 [bacterium]|nr:MAG: hypothetical protein FDZ71_00430 [bacterium]
MKEIYTLAWRQKRLIRAQAWLLVLCTALIGAATYGTIKREEIITAQDTLIKSQELRIINLVSKVEALEAEAEAAKIETITSRGGERMRYTLEEVKAMAKVVHAEAASEPPHGKMLVARVIMNRVEANPGMTVDDIINRPNAFAQADTFNEYDLHAVFQAAIEPRYRDVFTFFNPATASNREFVASKMPDAVLTVGNHVFCR